jgi:hypothetical protein
MLSAKLAMVKARAILFGALVLATTLTLGAGAASAAPAPPAPPFTVSPTSISFSNVPLGAVANQLVTVTTGGKKVALDNPASFAGTGDFFDTQAGTCWQLYGAQGKPVPARTACTIQVGFGPVTAGPLTDVMTVYACKKSHVDPANGFLLCDTLGVSQSVSLSGTVVLLPDLTFSSFRWGESNGTPYGYTVTIQNVGAATANLAGVWLAGYWGDGQVFDPLTQQGSCLKDLSLEQALAVGATLTIEVACGAFPGAPPAGATGIGVKIDFLDLLPESREDNNIVFAALP